MMKINCYFVSKTGGREGERDKCRTFLRLARVDTCTEYSETLFCKRWLLCKLCRVRTEMPGSSDNPFDFYAGESGCNLGRDTGCNE